MFEDKFKKALSFLDKYYFDYKTSDTGFHYLGLVFDEIFENSVFSIDYLNIEDYFEVISNVQYDETESLSIQYSSLNDECYAKLFNGIMSLIHKQKDEQSVKIEKRILNFFKRNNIYYILNGDYYSFYFEKIIGSGSYADVIYISESLLKKRLNKRNLDDFNQKKRFKYEYENMKKLSDVDSVLNVFEYNDEEHSYIMEKCDCCLYDYLVNNILTPEKANNIILQVLNSVKEIHSRNIIHRDIHLGNFLIKRDKIVISDFGLSKDLDIKRSLTSSDTPKNNNSFVDPVGLKDFRKLDKLSDIYSVGKVIEFIISNISDLQTIYAPIIEKCLERRRESRYQSIEEVISDVKNIQDEEDKKVKYLQIIQDMKKGNFNINVKNIVLNLTSNDSIADFIVQNRLLNFGKIFLNFNFTDQEKIAFSIRDNYVNATGYNGRNNYDIFASIASYITDSSQEIKIKRIFYLLLKEIANKYRWNAKGKLNYIESKYSYLKINENINS